MTKDEVLWRGKRLSEMTRAELEAAFEQLIRQTLNGFEERKRQFEVLRSFREARQ